MNNKYLSLLILAVGLLTSVPLTSARAQGTALNSFYFCIPEELLTQSGPDTVAEKEINRLSTILASIDRSVRFKASESADSDEEEDEKAQMEKYTCSLEDALSGELSCRSGDEAFSNIDVRGILACFKDGSKRLTKSHFFLKGWVGLRLGKSLLNLVGIDATYDRSNETSDFLFTCRNIETGEVKKGSSDEIARWYNDYLKSKKDDE